MPIGRPCDDGEHLGVPASWIATGTGSVGVLGQIVQATCDPGDEVVYVVHGVWPQMASNESSRLLAHQPDSTRDHRGHRAPPARSVQAMSFLGLGCS